MERNGLKSHLIWNFAVFGSGWTGGMKNSMVVDEKGWMRSSGKSEKDGWVLGGDMANGDQSS